MKYTVEISEILSRKIEVEAESPKDATAKAMSEYLQEKVVLDHNDLYDFNVEVL